MKDKSVGMRDGWTPVRSVGLEISQNHLREALKYAVANGAPKLADKIRSALKSAGGAIRHADNDASREARRTRPNA